MKMRVPSARFEMDSESRGRWVQPSLRDGTSRKPNPAFKRRATIGRPYGTECWMMIRTVCDPDPRAYSFFIASIN